MSEQHQGDSTSDFDDQPRCPWCSAVLDSAEAATCPSCNATLRDTADADLPGVTAIDHEALLRARKPVAKPGRLMGWLSGSYQEAPEAPPPPETLSPPDQAVKREMLRMELAALEAQVEAHRAELEAELVAAGVRPTSTGEAPDPSDPSDPPEEVASDEPGAPADGADLAPDAAGKASVTPPASPA